MIETFNDKDTTLVRYLFNELDEDARRDIEDEMLLDDELSNRLDVVEMNLIDGYVRDEMTDEERLRFDKGFLALAENLAKVEHARMYHRSLRRLREQAAVSPVPTGQRQGWLRRVQGLFRLPLPALALAGFALLFILAALYWTYSDRARPENSNAIASNSSPSAPHNANPTPAATTGGSLPLSTPSPRPTPTTVPTPLNVPSSRAPEVARNDPERYTREVCLFCADGRSVERGGTDAVPITLGSEVRQLKLRYELLGDVPERETFFVTIKNKYNDPLPLHNGEGRMEVKPFVRGEGARRKRFIVLTLSTSVFKDAGPYSFEIDVPNLRPQMFTIRKAPRAGR